MRIKNIPSIGSGDIGGGQNLAKKWRFKCIFGKPTKSQVFLRKGSQNRTQRLEESGKTFTNCQKTRQKQAGRSQGNRLKNW